MAKNNKNYISEDILRVLELAKYKIEYNVKDSFSLVYKFKNLSEFMPNGKDEILEYISNISIKVKKEQFLDFARSITPIVDRLFKDYIKEIINYDLGKCIIENKKNIEVIDCNKLDEDIKKLMREANFKFGTFNLSYSHLYFIIKAKSSDDEINKIIDILYDFSRKIRNNVAHNLMYIDESIIRIKTDLSVNKVVVALKELYLKINKNISKKDFDSYELINNSLLKKLK